MPISLTPIQKHVYRGILEKHADLIRAVMANRKKRPKPVPAITGGEATETPEVTDASNGSAVLPPTAEGVPAEPTSTIIDDGMQPAEAATSTSTDIEMGEATIGELKGPKEATTSLEKNTAADKPVPPVTNDIHDSIDQEMVIDTDNTDSAQVEDTI